MSRTTLRSALSLLEQEGVVTPAKTGRGRLVSKDGLQQSPLARSILILDPQFSELHASPTELCCVRQCAIQTIHALGLHAIVLQQNLCEGQHLARLIEERPLGLLVLSPMTDSLDIIESFLAARVPVACFADECGVTEAPSVGIDHRAGAASLTNWLLNRGRSRILPCWVFEEGEQQPLWLNDRTEGYRTALQEHGIAPLDPVQCKLVASRNDDAPSAFTKNARMLAGHLVEYLTNGESVDAIMAVSDQVAYTVAAACRIFNMEPNDDVEIVGFGNLRSVCREREWEPAGPVASVDLTPRVVAKELVDLVLHPPRECKDAKVIPKLVFFN